MAARADRPVIVLRGSHDNQTARPVRGRVVVALGEGAEERAVVGYAAEEARLRGVPLEAVRAWKVPALEPVGHPLLAGYPAPVHEERATEALKAALANLPPSATVRARTAEGHARRVLAAASHEADLLVIGVRRHPGHYMSQLGRTAHAVLHHSACPVALVPHG